MNPPPIQGASVGSLWPVVLIGVAGVAVFNLAPLFLRAAAARFSLGDDAIGWLLGAEIAGIALASFAVLVIAGRVSPRAIALVGLVVIVLGNPLAGMAEAYSLFLAIRFLIGLFGDGFVYVAVIMTLGRHRLPTRAFATLSLANMGLAGLGLSLLSTAEAPAFTMLFTTLGLIGILAWRRFPSLSPAGELAQSSVGRRASAAATLGLAGLFAYAINLGVVWGYAERAGAWIGLAEADIGLLIGTSVMLQAIGSAAAMALSVRVSPSRVLWVVAVAQAASLWMLANAAGPWGFLAAIGLWGFSWNLGIPQVLGILTSATQHGRTLALAPGTEALGAASGPLLAGALVMTTGPITVPLIAAMAAATAVAFSLGAARMTRRTKSL